MSVIAWDGRVLAADRQVTIGSLSTTGKKLVEWEGSAIAWTGDMAAGLVMLAWWKAGADFDKYPPSQLTDDWSRLIVANKDGVVMYERLPAAIECLDQFMAWGSGRDFALGAMDMGADARIAVGVASNFSNDCGMGVDYVVVNKP